MDQNPGDPPTGQMPGQFPPPPEDHPAAGGQRGGGLSGSPAGTYPLDMNRIFELMFRLFRSGWRRYVGISLLVAIPVAILLGVTTYFTSSEELDWLGQFQALLLGQTTQLPTSAALIALAVGLIVGAVAAIATFVAEAAVTRLASETFFGRPASAGSAVRYSLGRLLTLTGAYLLTFLASLAIAFAGILVASFLFLLTASGGQITPGPSVFLGLLVFVAAFAFLIFISIRWSLVVPVIVLEEVGAITALRRSWQIVSGSTWRVLGYILVFGIVFGLIGFIFTFALTAMVNPASLSVRTASAAMDPSRLAIISFGTAIISAVLAPFTAIGMMLLYLDLRWRRGEPVAQPGAAVADRSAG